jgi:EmrB/QacA subfamily drug resistance transporter
MFAVVGMALFMSTVDGTIVATALPAIDHSLNASINWTGWTITIYGLGVVVSLPVAGKLSHQFGCRKVLLCGVGLFASASLLCGAATSIYMLIVFRALQAIGGGALTPAASGIIADHFGSDRDRAIGLFGTMFGAGQIVGPVLGGFFVDDLSWRWIFLVNVPIGIVLCLLILRFVPETPLRPSSRLDTRGLALLSAMILVAIFGVTVLGTSSGTSHLLVFGACEVAALALLAVFLRHTRRDPDPFVPLRLLRGRGFGVVNIENFLFGAVNFGVASLFPLYAHNRYHLAGLGSGTLLSARAVGIISVGAVATFALRRTGYRLPVVVGMATVAAGTLMMCVAPRWGLSPYAWLSIGAGITGIGVGTANPATRNAGLHLAPNDVAAISGLRSMFTNLGVILSVSINTAILNRSTDPGTTEVYVLCGAVGLILFVMLPLTRWMPDHRGSW